MALSKARTSAGTTLSIASAPGAYTQAGFEALTFTEIGEVTDIGEFGKEFTLVTHNPLGNRKTIKRRGSYNNGQLAVQLARVPTDAGQAAMIAALNNMSDASYAFKVYFSQDGTTMYFTGQVMKYTAKVGNVNQILGASATIEIDDDIIEVAAP